MNKKIIPLVLIIILVICVVTGIVISKQYLIENNNINDVIEEETPKLEIDTNDDEDIYDTEDVIEDKVDGEDNKESQPQEEIDTNNDSTVNSNNSKPNSSSKPNNNTNTKPSKPNNDNNTNKDNENNKDEVVPTPPTQEQLNNEYRNSIYNTYGVKIAYGNEMGSYLVGNRIPTKMTNSTQINEYLGRIESELKKYPTGFFKEIKDYGMPATIYLVKDIPNSDISGITNSQFYSNIVISIKEGLLFEKTLNHEIMHYIDVYLNSKMYPNTVETEWNKLNPEGFVYSVFDTTYDYFPSQNNNAYFFNNYSQTNYKEDRATLFSDIMTRAYKRPCYSVGYPLYSKLKLLAEQIDEGFVTVNSSTIEYWEKYL